jgi:hypothetical protein
MANNVVYMQTNSHYQICFFRRREEKWTTICGEFLTSIHWRNVTCRQTADDVACSECKRLAEESQWPTLRELVLFERSLTEVGWRSGCVFMTWGSFSLKAYRMALTNIESFCSAISLVPFSLCCRNL